jgi:hypothetical protein
MRFGGSARTFERMLRACHARHQGRWRQNTVSLVKVKKLLFSRHLSRIASSSSYSSLSLSLSSLSLLLIIIVLLRSFLEDVDDATTVKASMIEKIPFHLCAITTRTAAGSLPW